MKFLLYIQNQQLVKLLFPLTEVKLVGDETKIYLIEKGLIDEVWHFSYLLSLTFLYQRLYIFYYTITYVSIFM